MPELPSQSSRSLLSAPKGRRKERAGGGGPLRHNPAHESLSIAFITPICFTVFDLVIRHALTVFNSG
jgi:hypothetical protein